jgi:hypothetical protein
LPALEQTNRHIRGDVWDVVFDDWDFGLFHPMCTYLTTSAAWAFGDGPYHQKVKPETLVGAERRRARDVALSCFGVLDRMNYPTAIENPAGSFLNTMYRKPDQVIQPYEFGDDASKATGLWLNGVPPLKINPYWRKPGRIVEWPKGSGKMRERWANQTDSGQNRLTPSVERWLERSATYPGIAAELGAQYGRYIASKNLMKTEAAQ